MFLSVYRDFISLFVEKVGLRSMVIVRNAINWKRKLKKVDFKYYYNIIYIFNVRERKVN